MRNKILFAFLLISPNLVFSQTDFRKGFIITTTRDTISGYIDFKEGNKAFEVCEFRASTESTIRSYSPSELVGYGFVNDKFYESRQVKKSEGLEVVFLEVLVKGTVSLYRLSGTFWVEKVGTDLYLLRNEKKEIYVKDKLYVKYTNEHIGILNTLLVDCQQITKSISKVDLAEKSLTVLIENYNTCMGADMKVFKEKKLWFKPVIGITGGTNISFLNFNSQDLAYAHLDGSFEPSMSPIGGVSLDIFSPRISERFSFHGMMLYSNSTYHRYSFIQSFSDFRNYVTIEVGQLKLPIGVRYTFPERKFTPYLNGGVSWAFHLSSGSSWIQEVEAGNVVTTNQSEALEIKDSQIGFWGGIGVHRSVSSNLKGFLEIRFERTDGLVPYSVATPDVFNSAITNFQIIVGIRTK